ncbi:Niemann-Pick C1 protein [Echinococcus granulosus]|uniref:Niemann-Pick C1 protein n=1 Tax=Echinococcus granulosus TaxID=6210 RepID=W6UQC0_ECHGR|nr:Niemann-Pick C1 protein [Echinococcus granulosus]EUB55584.1 Niemann-Pick C1 protein [Echinococcus granulosus]
MIHLSAGELLRKEMNSPNSKVAAEIESYMKAGTIVPVAITCSLLHKAMLEGYSSQKCVNYLVDGFPRNEDNKSGWEASMSDKTKVLQVVVLDCPDNVCIDRCLRRGSGRIDDNEKTLKNSGIGKNRVLQPSHFNVFTTVTSALDPPQPSAAQPSHRSCRRYEGIDHVHGSDGLAFRVFIVCVCDSAVQDHEHAAGLLVDELSDVFHAITAYQTSLVQFKTEGLPVIEYYTQKGLVTHIDGSKSKEEVIDEVKAALNPICWVSLFVEGLLPGCLGSQRGDVGSSAGRSSMFEGGGRLVSWMTIRGSIRVCVRVGLLLFVVIFALACSCSISGIKVIKCQHQMRHRALEMRLAFMHICILILFLVYRSNADCVMFGMCNSEQYCLVNQPPVSVPGSTLKKVCGIDSPDQCCDRKQLSGLDDNLLMLGFLVGDADDMTCYNGLRKIFCDMTCSPHQSELVKVTGHSAADGAVTSVDFPLSRGKAQVIFDACAAIEGGFTGRPIETICQTDNSDCDMETFFRILGLPKSSGGDSPYNINFVFTDDFADGNSTTLTPNLLPVNEVGEPAISDGLTTEDEVGGGAAGMVGKSEETLEDMALPQRLFKRPMWLAMLLTFLGLTLLFLLGLVIRWCVNRHSEDNTVAGSYSPPISCYSKVGATIQFGSTWLFARQGALVARFPRVTLLLTTILLAVACCGFLRFRVTTDPVELWSDPNSRARLEKAYFDGHFGPFYRTEQIIMRPVNATPYVRNDRTFGTVFDKDFLKSVLDLQTKVTRVRAFSEALGREVALNDICHKPLEPASQECGVFSPLEYFQSNATLLDAVVEGKDYLDHLVFCTKLIIADKGPLSGCRGRAGAPMFGNVVFGGIEDNDYMQSTAVVMTILVRNSVDHDSPTVLMAKAWESEFIRTVLNWRAAHPEVVVSFAAERSVEDEIVRQSHSDISTIVISYTIMVVYVSICLGNYRGLQTCLIDLKISLSIGGVSIVLASVFSSIGLWSYLGVPATLIIIEVIPFLVLAVGVDNIFIMVQDFLMHEQEEVDDDEDEDDAFGSQESIANGADDVVEEGVASSGGGCVGGGVGGCVGGKVRRQRCRRRRRRQDDGVDNGEVGKRLAGRAPVEARIAKTMGRVGPSMFLSSLAESVAFFCGAMTDMPAVRVFALYAGVAIVINFVLQIFAFTALLTLDARRLESSAFLSNGSVNRATTAITVNASLKTGSERFGDGVGAPLEAVAYESLDLALIRSHLDEGKTDWMDGRAGGRAGRRLDEWMREEADGWANRLDLCCCVEMVMPSESLTDEEDSMPETENLGKRRKNKRKSDRPWLYRFVAHVLAPFILSKWVRALLFILFLGWICFCIAIIPGGIHIGLDQKLSMSLDSYVLEYFEATSGLLAVGPPVYFVVTEGHSFDSVHGQNQICSRPGCDEDSLVNTLKQSIASKEYCISNPLMSWVDDYRMWSTHLSCCGVHKTEGGLTFCDSAREQNCDYCPTINGALSGKPFNQLLPNFLARVPSINCPYGGKAQHGSAVVLAASHPHSNFTATSTQQLRVLTSHFAAHHSILRTTEDFIEAIRKAREISDIFGPRWANESSMAIETTPMFSKLTSKPRGPQPNSVFPYSVFYVFYEQYLNIIHETMVQMSMGLSAVSVITWVMLGLDFIATLNVVVGVASIALSVTAMMVLWDISLNAISLVNLVVCIGISVEFCAHIVRSFAISTKATRVERALDALSEMGSSVLRGITLTKFGGIVVLGFAKSRLFQVFYFRMYLCMVLFGAVVGIIFLPVQLSYFGELEVAAFSGSDELITNAHRGQQDTVEQEVAPLVLCGGTTAESRDAVQAKATSRWEHKEELPPRSIPHLASTTTATVADSLTLSTSSKPPLPFRALVDLSPPSSTSYRSPLF